MNSIKGNASTRRRTMENIIQSLQVIYKSLEILVELNNQDLSKSQHQKIEKSIEYLEESRRLLYHEKNNRKKCIHF